MIDWSFGWYTFWIIYTRKINRNSKAYISLATLHLKLATLPEYSLFVVKLSSLSKKFGNLTEQKQK